MSLFDPPEYFEDSMPQRYWVSSAPIGWIQQDNQRVPVYINPPTAPQTEGEKSASFIVNWQEVFSAALPSIISGLVLTVVSTYVTIKALDKQKQKSR